jgi:hypothetical protein
MRHGQVQDCGCRSHAAAYRMHMSHYCADRYMLILLQAMRRRMRLILNKIHLLMADHSLARE